MQAYIVFTGRYIEIHMFSFSFKEYCEYYNDQSDKDKLFEEYFFNGGLAGSYAYNSDLDRITYIQVSDKRCIIFMF